ncbi:MAG: TetR/AcrR family transcriptional regulator [Nannocystaceae bacterium]|nr:TetR/AcrR family transcriptional regulator [Nannocystaceae bacterium]
MARALDKDEQRRSLALRCAPLFARHGYAAINMRQIAGELGVSTGVLYHYFPSKAALFEAVARATVQTDVDAGTQLLIGAARDPKERLGLLLHFMGKRMPVFAMHYRVLVEFSSQLDDEAAVEAWTRTLASLRERYARALGEILGVTDEGQRDHVLLTLCGLILRAMCGDPTTDLQRVARSLGRTLGWNEA